MPSDGAARGQASANRSVAAQAVHFVGGLAGLSSNLAQAHRAGPAGDEMLRFKPGEHRVLRPRQEVRLAIGAPVAAVGFEPGDAEAARAVELVVAVVQNLGQLLIDELQRLANAQRAAIGGEHRRVARVHGHPRTDRRLRQVNRREAGGLERRHGWR